MAQLKAKDSENDAGTKFTADQKVGWGGVMERKHKIASIDQEKQIWECFFFQDPGILTLSKTYLSLSCYILHIYK